MNEVDKNNASVHRQEQPPIERVANHAPYDQKNIGDTDDNSNSKKKESTRTHIAQVYVWGFFVVIGVVFLIGGIRNFNVNEYKDLLIAVSGILSGPLGFIVGYYFKASKE